MIGHLLLAGGDEFSGHMVQPDAQAIALAGGWNTPISVLPTAAAPDGRYQNAGSQAVHWFRNLGATRIEVLPINDKKSADDPWMANYIRTSRFIYFTDGFASYLYHALKDSSCLDSILEAYHRGAVIAGSGAGAMVLCQYFFEPMARQILPGFNLLPNTCVLPHHNQFGAGWVERLTQHIPGLVILGIDEQTALIDDGDGGKKIHWNVYGQGGVTLYRHGVPVRYNVGQRLIDTFK